MTEAFDVGLVMLCCSALLPVCLPGVSVMSLAGYSD